MARSRFWIYVYSGDGNGGDGGVIKIEGELSEVNEVGHRRTSIYMRRSDPLISMVFG
jgi:hypothetical protein